MVGPTVHPQVIDVLLRFRMYRIALIADVSIMYRAVELLPANRDLHRFVWRAEQGDNLKDYRMTRVTFEVSSSSFIATDLADKFPLAAKIVNDSFYVDDCLTGADSVEEAVEIHRQLYFSNHFPKPTFCCASGIRAALWFSKPYLPNYATHKPL